MENKKQLNLHEFFDLICGLDAEGSTVVATIDPQTGKIQPRKCKSFPEIQEFIETHKKNKNLHFTPAKMMLVGRKKRNAVSCRAAWVDLDDKDFPGDTPEARREALLASLNEFPFLPTVTVLTGGGIQAYWVLSRPLPKDQLSLLEEINFGLAVCLKGDDTYDITRLLRVPETINFPDERKQKLGRAATPVGQAVLVGPLYHLEELINYRKEIKRYNETSHNDIEDFGYPEQVINQLLSTNDLFSARWSGDHFTEKQGYPEEIDRSRNDFALANILKDLGLDKPTAAKILFHFPYGKGAERGPDYVLRTVNKAFSKEDVVVSSEKDTGRVGGFDFKSLKELFAEPMDAEGTFLVDGLLPRGGSSLLISKPKIGKSTLARDLILRVAKGEDFLNRRTQKGRVLYLALDESKRAVKKRLKDLGLGENDEVFVTFKRPANYLKDLEQDVQEKKPDLIVVDLLIHLLQIPDSNDYSEAGKAIYPVIDIARENDAHILFVHHAKKGDGLGIDSAMGSTALTGSVDTILFMGENSEGDRFIFSIHREGERIPKSILRMEESGLVRLGGTEYDHNLEMKKEAILDYVQANPGATEREIKEAVTGKTQVIGIALRKLVTDDGKLRRDKEPGGKGFRYYINEQALPLRIVNLGSS